jgi:hypothetical protein
MSGRAASAVSPLGAVGRGALAGAAGTTAMDLVLYARYKRGGGEQSLWAWEFGDGIRTWDDVSTPGQVGRRLLEGFLQRELPDRAARPVDNVVHWLYGLGWGAAYGIVAGSLHRRRGAGLAWGLVVWLTSYAVLPLAKLYRPIWEYDAKTLAKDLSAHLVFGTVTAVAFDVVRPRGRNQRGSRHLWVKRVARS